MATLSFESDSHEDMLRQVRAWLAQAEGDSTETTSSPPRSAAETIDMGADMTKQALHVIAEAAPAAVTEHELFQSLSELGLRVTDSTRDALKDTLDDVESATGGSVVNSVADASRSAAYSMNKAVAKEFLKLWVNS